MTSSLTSLKFKQVFKMLEIYVKLLTLLNDEERKRFYLLTVIMVVMTFLEIVGISTLLLLLNVLAEPAKITENQYLAWLYNSLSFTQVFYFQIFLSALVFIVVMLGLIIKAGGNYAIIRFSKMRGYTLSSRLLEAYLHQPYLWFLQRNSSEISKNVLVEVEGLVSRVMIPCLMMTANLMLSGSIIVFLLIVDPIIALMSALLIGGGYTLIYVYLRKRLTALGNELLETNRRRFQITQEATGGFKEVKLLGLEGAYLNRFQVPARQYASAGAMAQVMSQIPRFALEALTFAILLVIILVMLLRNDGNLTAAIPTLGIFAFSVMRLLPALQNVYHSVITIKAAGPVLDAIFKDTNNAKMNDVKRPVVTPHSERMPLRHQIELQEVSFGYPDTGKFSINKLNLKIPAKSKLGIVGGTGAGKTTLVDTILGFLVPASGKILIDGKELSRENIQAWRRSLGYVPQSIYLTDNTIAENIAFGIRPEDIDMVAVVNAARLAALHNFVVQELPGGYETVVGERGVRLSGGQRQRIGIARALYHDPELLILDEATSALDNLTERAIMDAVQNIGDEKTIIMIAHRLTTVRACDKIILLQQGSIEASGSYDELLDQNETFRRMASE